MRPRHSSKRDVTHDVWNEVVCDECLPAVGPAEQVEQGHHANETDVRDENAQTCAYERQ